VLYIGEDWEFVQNIQLDNMKVGETKRVGKKIEKIFYQKDEDKSKSIKPTSIPLNGMSRI